MLRLRDIMTTDVVCLTPQASVREALDVLGQRHLSGAPVLSGGKVVGVVTATDLMSFAAALPGVPTQAAEGEESEDWAEPGLEQAVEREVEAASAYFTELWDDAGAGTDQRMSSLSGPEWNTLEAHDISEVMTRPPLVAMAPDAGVEAAAEVMKEKRVHRVLVMEAGRLVGIVTAFDVTKAVAERKLTRRIFAFNQDDAFLDAE